MADELKDGRHFTIASYTDGHPPIGIDYTKPGWQDVYVDAPVHHWTAHNVCKDRYRFTVGKYHHVGVDGGKVVASVYPEHETVWEITHHRPQNGFTITIADRPHLGWTIPIDAGKNAKVVIGPIITAGSHFLPSQLFVLKARHEDDE